MKFLKKMKDGGPDKELTSDFWTRGWTIESFGTNHSIRIQARQDYLAGKGRSDNPWPVCSIESEVWSDTWDYERDKNKLRNEGKHNGS